MRVIPLGTSSGRPTVARHVSGLAVDLGRSWILIDCGEGTQQQIMRSPLKPSRLAAILITHLHGDHVLGLPGLLGTLGMEGRTAPLQIVGVDGIGRWLDVMCDLPILGIDFPMTLTELVDDSLDGVAGEPLHVADVDGFAVYALALRHRVPAFGYRIVEPDRPGHIDIDAARRAGVTNGPDLGRLQRGESVIGSLGEVRPAQVIGPQRRGLAVTVLGDTARCDASVSLAFDADLLVHECTYANADQDLAERWKHSTPADATWVANQAGVGHLVLNHFSTRYDDPSLLLNEARTAFVNTTLANELAPIDVPAADPT
ncbi:MAG: ribonuclease Z [Microthrixaceae bacterium]|nr:ribonuclease Z [Microthrixaceae bacterium]